MVERGKYIMFEGVEACGKGTQVEMLKRLFEAKGVDYTLVREPEGKFRTLVLYDDSIHLNGFENLMLYEAGRSNLLREKVIPALNDGHNVISDRGSPSTTAYQGFGEGQSRNLIDLLNSEATQGVFPDICFVIDLPLEEMYSRMQKQGRELDKMESKKKEFFEKVRQGYLTLAKENPSLYRLIEGAQSKEDVFAQIVKGLNLEFGWNL